jgi:hypothetical protein
MIIIYMSLAVLTILLAIRTLFWYSFYYREKPLDVQSNQMVQILPFIDLLSCANPRIEVVWLDVLMPMLAALANLRDGQIPQKIM